MNKKIREISEVNDLYIQDVANDAGLTLGPTVKKSYKNGFDIKSPDIYRGQATVIKGWKRL